MEKLKTDITSQISEGKSVSLWEEPGIYVIDFPSVSVRVAEDQIEEVIKDFEKIVKDFRKISKDRNI